MRAVTTDRRSAGRPEATSHADIEQAAFGLFAEHGFAATTLDAIAEAVGVSRRTVFRYYASKNDIPWGQFEQTLRRFRAVLDESPADLSVAEAVHRGVLEFNRFPEDAQPSHRERMRLLLATPELRAHSVHQYADWRRVIADYVAGRLDLSPDDLLPRVVGQVSLALALSAYEHWLDDDSLQLVAVLDKAFRQLRRYLASPGLAQS